MTSPKVEIVIKNACNSIGEGPHWDDASQCLYYVDIKDLDVHRWNSVTGEDTLVHLKDTVSLVVPRRHGGFIVGLGRRLSLLEWETATVTDIREVDRDTGNRFNDGKCDAKGRLWAGTMGYEGRPQKLEEKMGALYSLGIDRSVKKHLSGISISNGLAWTEDNQTMFYIDSIPRKIYAFNFDLEEGEISNQRVAVDFSPHTIDSYGLPDGMTIDTNGKLWVACYGAGAVYQFDPETGKTLQKIDIPAKQTTSVCWGGKNLDELFVTCAKQYITEEEFRTQQPLAGSVFRITGLETKGHPAYVYEG